MKSNVINQIDRIKTCLQDHENVKRIIIFGSQVFGGFSQESDIDVCIIADLQQKRKLELMREFRRELIKSVDNPLDILVYSEPEFMERAQLPNTLEHKISSAGMKIYG